MNRDLDRRIAGVRCRDLLEWLSDYVEGDLAAETRARVDGHLHGCPTCRRFGGEYGAMVSGFAEDPSRPTADPGVRARVLARLEREWDRDE